MPILRINGRLVYYCHVPKAAGTAMGAYLQEHFGALAFTDEQFYAQPARNRWSRNSPQHIDVDSLYRMFPAGFFDEIFALVRDPVPRTVSAYKFQKLVEGAIPVGTTFNDWVLGLDHTVIGKRFAFDHHLLPMNRLVPEGARTFRVEDGFGPVIDYLRHLAGPDAVLADAVAPTNVMSIRLKWMGVTDESVVVSDAARHHIANLYREDYERFGYTLPALRKPQTRATAVAGRNAEGPSSRAESDRRGERGARPLNQREHTLVQPARAGSDRASQPFGESGIITKISIPIAYEKVARTMGDTTGRSALESRDARAALSNEAVAELPPNILQRVLGSFSEVPPRIAHAVGRLTVFNEGGRRPPIFWCFNHYAEPVLLAARLGADQPLYAMHSFQGVLEDWREKQRYGPHLAQIYAQEILTIAAAAPILIGGNCQSASIIELAARMISKRRGKHPLLMMLESEPLHAYEGPLLMMFGDQSEHFNPFLKGPDPVARWQRRHSNAAWGIVRGTHGSYFREPGIFDLTSFLRQAVDAMEREGRLVDAEMRLPDRPNP